MPRSVSFVTQGGKVKSESQNCSQALVSHGGNSRNVSPGPRLPWRKLPECASGPRLHGRDPVSKALSQGLCLKDPVSEVLCQGSCLRGLISRILSQGSCLRDPFSGILSQRSCLRDPVSTSLSQGSCLRNLSHGKCTFPHFRINMVVLLSCNMLRVCVWMKIR